MEIFTGDPKVLEKEIEFCLENIHKSRNQAESYSLFKTIETLIIYYHCLTDNGHKYVKRLEKSNNFYRPQIEKANRLYNQILDQFIKNKDSHDQFIDCIFDKNEEISFEEDDYVFPINLNEKEMNEILLDFWKKKKPEDIPIYKDLIESKRMYKFNEEADAGYTVRNIFLNTNHVFIYDDEDKLQMLSVIAHEVGHVYDNLQIAFSKDNSYYLSKSPFVEVNSSLDEKRFYDFLIEEGIYKKNALDYLTDFYQSIFDEINHIQVLSRLPDDLLKRNKYKKLTSEKFYSNVDCLTDNIDDYLLDEPYEYNIMENVRYGYGRVLATYFSALEKNNPKRFDQIHSKFLNIRSGYFNNDFFERLGVSQDEISKTVREEIITTKPKTFIKK